IARGFIAEMDHPEFGRIMFPQGAIAGILGNRTVPAPTLGQHNAEILAELGYSETATQALRDSGTM
ncbi:MAG: CoA transferase, partial [Candidatus Binatia bacterium]